MIIEKVTKVQIRKEFLSNKKVSKLGLYNKYIS